jgi:hypothetical protein
MLLNPLKSLAKVDRQEDHQLEKVMILHLIRQKLIEL